MPVLMSVTRTEWSPCVDAIFVLQKKNLFRQKVQTKTPTCKALPLSNQVEIISWTMIMATFHLIIMYK